MTTTCTDPGTLPAIPTTTDEILQQWLREEGTRAVSYTHLTLPTNREV